DTAKQQVGRAEAAFEKVLKSELNEQAALSLATLWLLEEKLFNTPAYPKINELFAKNVLFQSTARQGEAFLLLARSALIEKEKEDYFAEATNATFRETSLYGQAWFEKGLFEYNQALNAKESKEPLQVTLNKASTSLANAFQFLKKDHPTKAAEALKTQALAELKKDSFEGVENGYRLLSSFFNRYNKLLHELDDQGMTYYLHNYAASKLIDHANDKDALLHAVETASSSLKNAFPTSSYLPENLHILATLYFQLSRYEKAEETFLRLAMDFPSSPYAGDAWFWTSESADWQQRDQPVVAAYRRHVFEKYPHSAHAPEAFFRVYSFSQYLQGDPAAIEHLNTMEERYPTSYYLIAAHYLLGLHQANIAQDKTDPKKQTHALLAATTHFDQAQKSFDLFYEKEAIPTQEVDYFASIRYRALLQKASVSYNKAYSEEEGPKKQVSFDTAIATLQQVTREFDDPTHSLASRFHTNNHYPSILEEAEYLLGKSLNEAGDKTAAEAIFSKMLDRYHKDKIKRGYYLSRAWNQLAILTEEKGEYALALQYLNHAEESAIGQVLKTDQRLDLWTQQAECLIALKEFDHAMLKLSSIINDNSASSQRVYAMFLRAQVYEQQGNEELALKQLEATAKKSGPWAMQAKEKLRKKYVPY
ncbi:tetratricopeptide repeat protein, partial [Simkania negevensis]|nr:tetratricopeptide repeat protein [Simkania negevensis]